MTNQEGSQRGSRWKAIGAVVVSVLVALAVIGHIATGGMAHHGLSGARASQDRVDGGGP